MKAGRQRKNLAGFSFFSGSTLAMAFSLLAVIVLLIWWQSLLTRHLEVQYRFFAAQVEPGEEVSPDLVRLIRDQDEKLAQRLISSAGIAAADAQTIIQDRLANRQKMVLYERTFFILLLLSGHLFFLYIYFRERYRRRLTEETILLATHELRQPLQSLSLALETAQMGARGKSKVAIETGLADISRLGQHIRWLAANFAGSPKSREKFDVPDLRSYLEACFAEEFSVQDRARLNLQGLPPLGISLGLSEPLFRFVVRNLTENALRYASGNVTFAAESATRRFSLRISNDGQQIERSVFQRLGNMFFRSPQAGVQNKTGFGLGLYLCGRIVHRARGKLNLENDSAGRTVAELILRPA